MIKINDINKIIEAELKKISVYELKKDIERSLKEVAYRDLGIEYNRYDGFKVVSYGGKINEIMKGFELINDEELKKLINEIVPEINNSELMSMFTKSDKATLRKNFKNNLMTEISSNLNKLVNDYAKNIAKDMFEEYIKEEE